MAGAWDRPDPALTRAYPSACRYTALLGGSFNPAHGAHRRITLCAIRALALDEAWWLVSPGNPLKPRDGMAALSARFASARRQARRAPIRVTAIERELSTRYTIDTLRALCRRYPKRRFVWLMGADNLAQFDRWRRWRDIARLMPIAVVCRPGYDARAMTSPAMAWLRRFRVPAARLRSRESWSAPALVILRFDPDDRSASAIRAADPFWLTPERHAGLHDTGPRDHLMRDGVTHRPIPTDAA